MKIFVCVKAVPDTETKVRLSADAKSIDFTGVKFILNPYDELAIEEAIKLRDANPGSSTLVISCGPKKWSAEPLRTALAMGIDEALLVDGQEYMEPALTAEALSKVIRAEGSPDLILMGKLSIDQNSSSVPQMVAHHLGLPHATVVSKLSIEAGRAVIERDVEGGAKEVCELTLPAVIAANKGLNMPRYASLPGIMKAKKKVIKEVSLASLDCSPSRTQLAGVFLPPEKPAVKMLSGDGSAQVVELVKLLRDEAKVL
jgi:electron transfer flavoprotein beta subunit